ncbi:MAG TPA: DUF309 domain-containing protein [Leptolyngbyaceae cyanobacterium M33_DOE_097]|uniref:DUF309 domain-containing protein n=1 Tax=Oscillatoriales cyanobacterium SpSt-418 TaxID=2282169 RepID=A0A7C3KBG1_9CYAN|nr:DUF309 domain-containing protein [Leptolyngbyaceae cyanobacterium M33_DOE_097]
MEEIPAEFWQAVEQFNQRQFYACHDTLEAIWMEAPQPDKRFYQGILQVAVGLYHFGNLNWRGAVISMGEGLGRLQHYLPDYAEIDVESFVDETSQLLKVLQAEGADKVADLLQQITQTDETRDRRLLFPVLKRLA